MSLRPWSESRDRWLTVATQTLERDSRVVGYGLVGSFGRRAADAWSDVDLLLAVNDADYLEWTSGNELWSQAAALFLAPHNTRATATSAGSLHVLDDVPIGADWYVFRASEAEWPVDCLVLAGRDAVASTNLSFDQWNALGDLGSPVAMSPEDQLAARLAMVTIAGKYVARRSDDASPMIEFLVGNPVESGPASQLGALESLVRDAAVPGLTEPILRYLTLVSEA